MTLKGRMRERTNRNRTLIVDLSIHSLLVIPDDIPIWITSGARQKILGNINHQAETSRSYVVNTPSGQACINCRHRTVRTDDTTETSQNENTSGERDLSSITENSSQVESCSPIMTRSHTGAVVNPLNCLTF